MVSSFAALLLSLSCVAFTSAAPHASSESATANCTDSNIQVRQEWGSLSKSARLNYINAVKCLRTKPSKIPAGVAPGAKNRYDDFIAVHINRTTQIHSSGLFLTWHRRYIQLFEEALHDDCGWNGTLPYWNWPLWSGNLSASPIFDGSDTSLSGDGQYNPNATKATPFGMTIPQGHGGGCVTTGPFANLTLNFKNFGQNDINTLIYNNSGVVPKSALDYSPHCFSRNLNNYVSSHWTNKTAVNYLIYKSPNISDFQIIMDGQPQLTNAGPGVHPGGHYSAGPDLWDLFASPSDPAFWLHHGMIDLVYTTWQAQDPKTRLTALSGTHTFVNQPPSANVTLDTVQTWEYLGQPMQIKDLMSAMAGPFCYKYASSY